MPGGGMAGQPPAPATRQRQPCQIRSKDIAHIKGQERMGVSLKSVHSLKGFRLQHVDDEEERDSTSALRDNVQDVLALQIVGVRMPARLDTQSVGHAILRLVDDHDHDHSSSSMTTMLTRARETGGGILARKLIPDKLNYRLIGEWLQLCRSGHVRCDSREADEGDGGVGTGQTPGFQVIDCTTGNIMSFASLSGSTSSGEQSQTPDYITLSYVWGQGPFEGPVRQQQRLSLPGSLPLTISDTIQAVQRLGYRYLWIDRYCIPQDDLPAKQI
ncbi:hypothetical protein N0V85_008181 [Neurospora sp. IMI 360204]|nr:hypothetical protein N0V85_008181 [Neurospora sp. IMI 360204]